MSPTPELRPQGTRVINVLPAPGAEESPGERAQRLALGPGSLRLGGAAVSGAAAPSVQHAQAAGALRPAALLRLGLGSHDYASKRAEHEAALEGWLREALRGCALLRPKASWALNRASLRAETVGLCRTMYTLPDDLERSMGTEDGTNATLVAGVQASRADVSGANRAVAEAFKVAASQAPGLGVGDSIREISAVVADLLSDAVEDAADGVVNVVTEVLEFIPGVGILMAGIKAVKSSIFLIVSEVKRLRNSQLRGSSISVIEREALWAVDCFEARVQMQEGRNLASAVITGASHSLGYAGLAMGPVAKAVTSVINLTAKIVQLIADVVAVGRANRRIAAGALTVAALRDTPALGLALPHLPGAHALSTLGIVPPGWTAAANPGQLAKIQRELRHPANATLLAALDGIRPRLGGAAVASAHAAQRNLWAEELARLKWLFDETNRHAHDFPWVLMRADRQLWEPQAVGLTQRAKAAAQSFGKRTAAAAWHRIQQVPALIGVGVAEAPSGGAPAEAPASTGSAAASTGAGAAEAPALGAAGGEVTHAEVEALDGWHDMVLEDIETDDDEGDHGSVRTIAGGGR
jgi:hypothetical protein